MGTSKIRNIELL